jgi:molecular chaperone HtpG
MGRQSCFSSLASKRGRFLRADEGHCDLQDRFGDYVNHRRIQSPQSQRRRKKPKIWYAASEDTQVSYLNADEGTGHSKWFSRNSPLDTHLFQSWKAKLDKIEFLRIDSEVNDLLVNKDGVAVEAEDKAEGNFLQSPGSKRGSQLQ